MKTLAHICVFTFVFVFSFATVTFAQTNPQKDISNVTIKNFGQMDEHFYRGGQPKKDEYKELADLGVNTVIDLRDDPKDYEKPSVESLGMKYINIPMSDTEYPPAESIEAFLKIVNDPSTGVFFVHCKGGKHRTGATGAVYRFTKYGWDYERVYEEMKDYNFYTFFGRYGEIKDFVKDYAEKMKTAKKESNETVQAKSQTVQ